MYLYIIVLRKDVMPNYINKFVSICHVCTYSNYINKFIKENYPKKMPNKIIHYILTPTNIKNDKLMPNLTTNIS
jgi:hypothetical protein